MLERIGEEICQHLVNLIVIVPERQGPTAGKVGERELYVPLLGVFAEAGLGLGEMEDDVVFGELLSCHTALLLAEVEKLVDERGDLAEIIPEALEFGIHPRDLSPLREQAFHRTRHQRDRGAYLVGNIGKELHLGAVELLDFLLLKLLLLLLNANNGGHFFYYSRKHGSIKFLFDLK